MESQIAIYRGPSDIIVGAGAFDGPTECSSYSPKTNAKSKYRSAGARCVAQRIKISMIAGGNHTIIQVGAAPYSGCYLPAKLKFALYTIIIHYTSTGAGFPVL